MRSQFTTHFRSALALVALAAVAGALVACQPRQRESVNAWTADGIELNVRSSDQSVLSGQVVVLTADATNALGRDVRVEWDAPGGELETEEGGHIARVRYDRPGTYIIVSRLYVNDDLHRTETTRVTVRPVN